MRDRRLERLTDALRPVRGVEEIQVVGALPTYLQLLLPFRSRVQSVCLHWDTIEHIAGRRGVDVDFCLAHLPSVILRPTFYGRPAFTLGVPYPFHLADHIPGDGRYLLVGLKFVGAPYADSGLDELWVSTAYALGESSLRRYLKRGDLAPVVRREDDISL